MGETVPTVPNISAEDRSKIQQLRDAVADELTPYYNTDFNLLRWLKGHNYDIDEIVPKLKNHLILRKSHFDLDHVADRPRDHPIHHYWKHGLTICAGPMNADSLVNIEQTGTNDFWGLLHTYPLNEIMKARIYDLERMLRAVMEHEKKTGNQASIMYIMDLTGLKYHANLLSLLRGPLASISAFMSEHYVELIHTFVLVGVPSFIHAIWAIAKPLLPERTKNKVKILGGNWRTEILEIAVPESLPEFWNVEGGEKIFSAKIERSVPINPDDYHKRGTELDNAKELTVGAGKFAFVDIQVQQGQKLSWAFETNGHFAYALFRADTVAESDLAKMTVVYPRFNKVPGPTNVPVADSMVCALAGAYKFWFSNEHAWIHTLHVNYVLHVE